MPFIPITDVAKVKKFTDEPKFGLVVDNMDPEKLGRIKVCIPGLFEGEPDSLPWVRRKMDTAFCGQNCEIFDVPEVGSVVEVKWNYDANTPLYSGTPYNEKHTTKVFNNNYPYEGGIVFGKMYIKFDKATNLMTISNGKTFIQCDPMGNMSLVASGNIDISAQRDINVTAPNVNFKSNVNVDGSLYCKQAANGSITPLTIATVAGGIVTGLD